MIASAFSACAKFDISKDSDPRLECKPSSPTPRQFAAQA
jgi:hypothetical protein